MPTRRTALALLGAAPLAVQAKPRSAMQAQIAECRRLRDAVNNLPLGQPDEVYETACEAYEAAEDALQLLPPQDDADLLELARYAIWSDAIDVNSDLGEWVAEKMAA